MQRPQILRGDNELVKTLNMFKTQPYQNFNILYDAFGNLAAKSRAYKNTGTDEAKAAYNEAKINAARAVSSQAVAAAVFAIMQFAWKWFTGKDKKYKDKDEEYTFLSWLKGIGMDVAASVAGYVPFGSELLEFGEATTDGVLKEMDKEPIFDQKWYGVEVSFLEAIADTTDAAAKLITATTDILKAADSDKGVSAEKWETYIRQLSDTATDAAKLKGVPAENVQKLLAASARRVLRGVEGEYMGEYLALRITSDPAKYSSDYYDLLYKAYKNDKSAYNKILSELQKNANFTDERIKSNMENRMKKDQGVSKVEDLDIRFMLPEQQSAYGSMYRQIESSGLLKKASDEQRKDVEDLLYGIAVKNSSTETAREKIEGGKDVGLDSAEYVLYRLALSMADKPTENGKMGTYTAAEKEEAIDMVPGLSKNERSYLWLSSGGSVKSNPYK